MMNYTPEIWALAEHYNQHPMDIECTGYTYEVDGMGIRVLTDEEADEQAREYILDTCWAFNASFLCSHMETDVPQDMIEAYQEKCEGANEGILGMIKDKDEFVEDAIHWDGRGHFMSSYDGEEIELKYDLYAYREN